MTKQMQMGLDKELLDGIAKVVLAVTGFVGSAVALIKVVLPWAERRAGTASGLDQLQILHDTMKSCFEVGAERVVIFYGHNSGGYPRPGSPFYATAVHWETIEGYGKMAGKPEESIRDYANLPVDGAYIEMLNEMREHGSYRFTTKDEDSCILKHIYELAEVKDSLLVYLGIFKKRIYYASFARRDGLYERDELYALEVKANLIRHIITKAQK